jgi:nucleotide-binding universal stress UspA family protein
MSRSDVIVGLDDSVAAEAALGWAAQHARVYGLRLTAVHVSAFLADPPVGWSPDTAPPEGRPDLELGPMAERVRTGFSSINPDPGWSLYFVGGAPGRALVDIARNAGLLALGTREHTGVGRLLAGSVSHFCVSHSTVPIAAVPAPVDSIVSARRPRALGERLEGVPYPDNAHRGWR